MPCGVCFSQPAAAVSEEVATACDNGDVGIDFEDERDATLNVALQHELDGSPLVAEVVHNVKEHVKRLQDNGYAERIANLLSVFGNVFPRVGGHVSSCSW